MSRSAPLLFWAVVISAVAFNEAFRFEIIENQTRQGYEASRDKLPAPRSRLHAMSNEEFLMIFLQAAPVFCLQIRLHH